MVEMMEGEGSGEFIENNAIANLTQVNSGQPEVAEAPQPIEGVTLTQEVVQEILTEK